MTVGELKLWLASFPEDWVVTGEGLSIRYVTQRRGDSGEHVVDLSRKLVGPREDVPVGR